MLNKVVLLDLENITPSAKMLREIIEHYSTLYLFNCQGKFEYLLEDLTELAGWISHGQMIILDTPNIENKEYQYAVIVGQLMALLELDTHIELISSMPSHDSSLLIQLLQDADISCNLIQIQKNIDRTASQLPSADKNQAKPHLQLVKKYCDALGKMSGKPSSIESLKNSVANILQIVPEKAQHLVGMLINLRIVKRIEDQVSYRKSVLKQWVDLNMLSPQDQAKETIAVSDEKNNKIIQIDDLLQRLSQESAQVLAEIEGQSSFKNIQPLLYKNFDKIDPVQMEVIHKLNDLNSDKPKDIYELRDLLAEMFPESDVRLLLKELIEKGYIYWNGHEVVYSHEMYLN